MRTALLLLGLAPLLAGPSPALPAAPAPAPFRGHTGMVDVAAFSGDGRRLVTASADGTIKVWEVSSGRNLATVRRPRGGTPALSADGRTLIVATAEGVQFWDAESGCPAGHPVRGTAPVLSPCGRVWGINRTGWLIDLWDVKAGRARATLRARSEVGKSFRSMTFSPDGKLLATVTHDRTVVVWSTATGQELATLSGHTIDLRQRAPRFETRVPLPGARLKLTPFPSPVVIAFSPDGRTLASGAEEIRLWDVHAGRETRALLRVAGGVGHLAFSGDGRTLTAVSQNFSPGLVGRRSDKAPGDVTKLVVRPWDFTELVVRQWDVATRREKAVATLRAYRKDGRKVAPGLWFAAFTPDLMMMASPTANHSIRLWDVAHALHEARPRADR